MESEPLNPHPLETVCCPVCGKEDAFPAIRLRELLHQMPGEFTMVRCRGCSVYYLNPRPGKQAMGAFYPEDYYSYEAPVPIKTNVSFSGWKGGLKRKIFQSGSLLGGLLKNIFVKWDSNWRWFYAANPMTPSRKMLEIGSGAGQTLLFFKSYGWEAWGIDLDSGGVSRRDLNGIKKISGDFLDVELPENYFDLIWLSHSFEHMHEPRSVLMKIKKHLQKEGRVYIEIPVADAVNPWMFRSYSPIWDAPRHLTLFTRKTIFRLAEESGYTVQWLGRTASAQSIFVSVHNRINQSRLSAIQKKRVNEVALFFLTIPAMIFAAAVRCFGGGEVCFLELRLQSDRK